MTAHEFKRALISILYPNRCPFCNKVIDSSKYFCKECFEKLDFISISEIPKGTDGLIAVCVYDEAAKSIIYPLKNENSGYAAWAIAKLICDRIEALGAEFDVITAVPMHKKDYAERGYNQSVLIAKELSTLTGFAFSKKGVVKTKLTKSQKTLSEAERHTNVKGAYKIKKAADFAGKRVLLIDDVCTTGSTLSEVSSVILTAGAKSVTGAVFAKTVKTS